MIVQKFGGTSVGNAERMQHVADIVTHGEEQKLVVLSAVSGTTNMLYDLCSYSRSGDQAAISAGIKKLEDQYHQYAVDLLGETAEGYDLVDSWIKELSEALKAANNLEYKVVALGEMFSTRLFTLYLTSRQVSSKLLLATDYITLNAEKEPDIDDIATKLNPDLVKSDVRIHVIQGFICLDHTGEMSNLQRGGSDYTASLIGAAINAEEIQIWTDIDGMHNNDPRVVEHTRPISKLSFNEAAELAYFGAKILHPATIQPAKRREINVKIKNTLDPQAEGTLITRVKRPKEASVKAVAAKDNITAIKIRSSRMLMAYGFLRKVFEVFEQFKTPIDMITTSEVAVSLTIDDTTNLYEIISALETFGEVEVDYDQSIVCIVGNLVSEDKGLVTRIFESLAEVPLRMISYGGSRNNISILVPSNVKSQTLHALNAGLFKL